MPEVKVVVTQESQGDALKKTGEQLDAVGQKADAAGKKVDAASSRPAPKIIDGTAPAAKAAPGAVGGTRQIAKDRNANLAAAVPDMTGPALTEKEAAKARVAAAKEAAAIERAAAKEAAAARKAAAKEAAATEKAAKSEADAAYRSAAAKIRPVGSGSATENTESTEKKQPGRKGRSGAFANGLLTIGREATTGGGVAGNEAGLIAAATRLPGGPVVKGIAILGAAVAGFFANAANEVDKDASQQNEVTASRSSNARRRAATASWRGSSTEAGQEAFAAKEEQRRLQEERPELEKEAKEKWYNPATWTWGGLRKNAGQRALEKNTEAQKTAKIDEEESKKSQFEKASREEPGLELNIARALSQKNVEGKKEARLNQDKLTWLQSYRTALAQFGETPEGEIKAKESADLAVKQQEIDRMKNAAAGIVNARSGAADVARAASLAASASPDSDRTHSAINAMHQTLKSINENASRHDHGS